ncbi:hypothetical protein AVEN_24094-1 [Araneus ventricosus]|uniref:Uncharacterized protein n=1 Tax=Araneus ventricosus TaxID=182803 RepID=A0A4Y2GM74_ARAVE|nr:hypothetical protein AVEN_24094-1 [Araneus ventricosus]
MASVLFFSLLQRPYFAISTTRDIELKVIRCFYFVDMEPSYTIETASRGALAKMQEIGHGLQMVEFQLIQDEVQLDFPNLEAIEGFINDVLHYLTNVRSLRFFNNCTNGNLEAVSTSCEQLEHLYLYRCPVLDDGLESVLINFPGITLEVENCYEVYNDAITRLRRDFINADIIYTDDRIGDENSDSDGSYMDENEYNESKDFQQQHSSDSDD